MGAAVSLDTATSVVVDLPPCGNSAGEACGPYPAVPTGPCDSRAPIVFSFDLNLPGDLVDGDLIEPPTVGASFDIRITSSSSPLIGDCLNDGRGSAAPGSATPPVVAVVDICNDRVPVECCRDATAPGNSAR